MILDVDLGRWLIGKGQKGARTATGNCDMMVLQDTGGSHGAATVHHVLESNGSKQEILFCTCSTGSRELNGNDRHKFKVLML